MAGLSSTIIIAACVGAQGTANQACVNAVDAGTRQMGIRDTVDQIETNTVRYLDSEVQKQLNQDQLSALAIAGFVYKTAKEKKLTVNLPTLGVCDSVKNEITKNSYSLTLQWKIK